VFELTTIEGDLADHDPFSCEVELQPHVTAHAIMQFYGDVARVLHDDIGHIGEEHWLPEELMAANTEVHFGV
jgi:hypothetical protein